MKCTFNSYYIKQICILPNIIYYVNFIYKMSYDKSSIKLKLWILHSKDCTALHDVKFKNCMLFLCVSSRYKGIYTY